MTGSDQQTEGPSVSPLAPKGGFPKLPIVAGARFASGAAGVKYRNRDDVMLAEVAAGSSVAGVFTTSRTRSAPVLDCERKLAALLNEDSSDSPIGLVVNSGNANAFTGKAGDGSVDAVSQAAAIVLGTNADRVFTASTGVIGEPLPHDRIVEKLGDLSGKLSLDKAEAAAKAIMTTDTFAKGAYSTIEVGGESVTIAGFAKGSGMIAPDMATMLVYIFTDANITSPALQSMVSDLNKTTFNSITVDGDTSTSDSLMVFATGAAGNPRIQDISTPGADAFKTSLNNVMLELAHLVVKDGEGATKFIEIQVSGAENDVAAHKVGMSIANSPLIKTAFAGEDPNWGRVVMAVGKSGENADRDRLAVRFGDIPVAENGWVAETYKEEDGAAYMKGDSLVLGVDLGVGDGAATVWTCDLTHGYITINADYRS